MLQVKNRFVLFAIVASLLIWMPMSISVFAHHGAASFDPGKMITLKGTVKSWVYSNPHCLLTLSVRGDDGQTVDWITETQAPNVIYPVGYRKDTFKFGEEITIIVQPVKNGRPLGRILQAILTDGTKLGVLPQETPAPNPAQ